MGVHRRRGLRGDRVRRAAPRGRRLNAGASEGGAPPADLARARLLCLAAPVVLSLVWVPAAYPSWALGSCLLLLLGAATLAADGAAPRRGALALAILSTAWCVAGLAWAPVPANGLEAASGAVQFALAFGLALSLADAGRGRFAAGGALFIGALAVWGAYQAVGPAGWPRTYATLAARLASEMDPSDPLLGSLAHTLSERRAAGTLGSPNVFASICAAGALLAAGCWAGAARTGRAALAAACAACLAGLWLSGSRGGVLGFLAGAVVFAALLGGGRLARTGAAAALVALLAASCGPSSDASRWLGSTTVAQRAAYWRTGAELARAHPLRGLGAGGYATLYHTRRIAGANETKFAHNWLVQRAVDQGAVGALLFAGAAAWALGAGARRLRGDAAAERALRAGALAAAAALLVHGLADFALDTREGLLVLGALLGLAAGSGVPEAPAGRGLAAATLAAVLLAAGALWHTQARPGFAQQRLEAAQDAFAYGNDAGEALEQIGQALEWQPNDPALWERRAAYRLAMRDAGALGDLRRAIELSPASAGLRDALAQALLAARQPRAAADAAREAVELHPLDAGHRLTLAEALLALDDREGARSELESAGKLQRNRAEQFRLDTLTAALAGGGA